VSRPKRFGLARTQAAKAKRRRPGLPGDRPSDGLKKRFMNGGWLHAYHLLPRDIGGCRHRGFLQLTVSDNCGGPPADA